MVRRAIRFDEPAGRRAVSGWGLIVYALVVYPVLGWLLGRVYPAAPTFGLPCPTTIFSVGLLMLAAPGLPRVVLVAPLLWTVVGSSAAFLLGVHEDLGLLAAGTGVVWIGWRR